MPAVLKPRRYRFGIFEADVSKGELLRQGERIRLQEQPFRLLILLLERAGEVVSREDLRTWLWPENTFVEFDNGVNVAIRKLRDGLGDNPETPRYIETIPRRGYRFRAPVTVTEEPPHPAPVQAVEIDPLPSPAAPTVEASLQEPAQKLKAWYALAILATLTIATFAGARFYLHYRASVLSAKDTVVVADFENTTGDPVFDDSLKQAVEVGLGQSPFLNVMSERKTGAILMQMGRTPDDRMTGRVAIEVCQRASSKAEVQGSILSLGSSYLIGLAAIRCDNGDPVAQEQVQVRSKEDVVAALGKATTQLRAKLGESLPSIHDNDVPLELATTSSLEALKTYNHALTTWDRKGDVPSVPLFVRAIELDANFATAYGGLATVYHNLNEDELAQQTISKAYELRNRLPLSERLSLEGRYHLYVTGDLYKAADVYELRIRNHENLPGSLTNLGNIEIQLGNYDEAAEDFGEVVRLDPTRAAAYFNVATVLMVLGRGDQADAWLAKAEERKIRTDGVLLVEYLSAFLKNDKAAMDRYLLQTTDVAGAQSLLVTAQANTEAYYGHVRRAHDLSVAAADIMEHAGDKGSAASCLAEAGLREADEGAPKLARDSINAALRLGHSENVLALAAVVMARVGDASRARAISQELDHDHPQDTMIQRYWLPTIRAVIDLQSGRPSDAVALLSGFGSLDYAYPHVPSVPSLYPVYVRGQAFLAQGDADRAAAEFQKIIDHRTTIFNFPIASLAQLQRARAFARSTDHVQEAHNAYQQFLDRWKDADLGTPLIDQAKREDRNLHLSGPEFATLKPVK
ncbi:MAG TPA: winged helix-turn-helix domain-containing protein [Terriglobales bacterium]|nr:winged helix-turn-helix domain-containing protein [Terriglobales bacterium]